MQSYKVVVGRRKIKEEEGKREEKTFHGKHQTSSSACQFKPNRLYRRV